jgi:MFS-type transporter involved in bile tolerance (Atg22 family)
MRKKVFRFFAAIFSITLLITFFLFTELSYVGVKIQYFLLAVLVFTFAPSYFLYQKKSGYLGWLDEES